MVVRGGAKNEREFRAETRRKIRLLNLEVTAEAIVAVVALGLSVATVATQVWLALRSPDIDAVPLDRGIFYWDGTKSGAVLAVAFQVKLINSSGADHGDMVERAGISLSIPGLGPVRFGLQSLIEPHLVTDPEKVADRCAVSDRCLPLDGLVVVDQGDQLISLPGGSSRSDYLSFALVSSECAGQQTACAKFADFEAAVRTLSGVPLSAVLTIAFHKAHAVALNCISMSKFDGSWVLKHKYWTFACRGADPSTLLSK